MPLAHCSEPGGANAYLELDVRNPYSQKQFGEAWVFTKNGTWVHTGTLHIELQLVAPDTSELTWWADMPDVDWMNGAYQGWFGSSQVNTLTPEHKRTRPYIQGALWHAQAGQRYAVYAALPPGKAGGLGCFSTDGLHPFLSL